MLNTFTRELNCMGAAFTGMAGFFASFLQIIFFMIVPFYISWQVTGISILTALLFAVPFIMLGKRSYNLGLVGTSTGNETASILHENLSLAKIILGFGNERKNVENYNRSFIKHCRAVIKSQILLASIPILYRPFAAIMMIIALFSARWFNVALSETTVLLLALLQVAFSVSILTSQKNSIENFFPSYEQIKRLQNRAKSLRQHSGVKEFKGFASELNIRNLSFAYPAHKPVLRNISMRIPKGKMVAIAGKSGAGKSTLIDIIMGFHQPTAGRIMIDNNALQDFDIHSYRHRIGYVPQDSVLFNMTIRDNLLWANESAADEQIAQACHQANADEFIGRLPKGYDTLVGDRGVRLSGGQVQRIALARAILRKPKLLVLDEATSSLDTHSERLIQEAIENIARETTVIVIAHRLSTIVNADYIYMLEEGCIMEEGTYSELVQQGGHFKHMVELQALGEVKE